MCFPAQCDTEPDNASSKQTNDVFGVQQRSDVGRYCVLAVGSPSEPQIESGFPAVFPSSPKVGDNVTIECFARGYTTYVSC